MTIGAVVLAAGLSQRMGQPKLVLPWGETTIIGRIVDVLLCSGIDPVVVVTGGAHDQVARALLGMPVRIAFNERFQEDQMAYSLQTGLDALSPDVVAVLVVLGDQPQIDEQVVRAIIKEFHTTGKALIVPSYKMRRGHPWLVGRLLWPVLRAIQLPDTLRDFLSKRAGEIHYLDVETATVLQDLDTPEDYQRQAPK